MNKEDIYKRAFHSRALQRPIFELNNTLIQGYDFMFDIITDLIDRVNNNTDLEESLFMEWGRTSLKQKRWFYNCSNGQDVFERMHKVIDLYNQIKEKGYSPELAFEYDGLDTNTYPISLFFDETGQAMVCDGNHRLSILKYLGIEIDVDCAITNSRDCLDTERTGMIEGDFALPNLLQVVNSGKNLYQPNTDPRCEGWNLWRKDCPERLEYIKKGLNLQIWERATILDIGCSEGYFSRELSKLGFNVTALDTDKRRIAVARYLALKDNQDIQYITGDWREELQKDKKWDNIIMLSVWHHSVLNEGLSKSLEYLELFRGKCRRLVIETPLSAKDISWTEDDKKDLFNFSLNGFCKILQQRTGMKVFITWEGSIGRLFIFLKEE